MESVAGTFEIRYAIHKEMQNRFLIGCKQVQILKSFITLTLKQVSNRFNIFSNMY